MAHLDFRLREGRREEKQRLVPAPGDTLSRWGCLLRGSWLPGTAWLAGAFHLLALGSQAVEQEERRVCPSYASSRDKAPRIHLTQCFFLGGEKGLERRF